jgi:Flp pilus assembly pilin Flp
MPLWLHRRYLRPSLRHHDERGQGMVKCTLIVILVAAVVIMTLLVIDKQAHQVFANVSPELG